MITGVSAAASPRWPRPVRRKAVLRLRAALSQARRPGRADLSRPEPGVLGRTGGSADGRSWRRTLHDEILFNGATFGDLRSRRRAVHRGLATDISTGSRVPFNQNIFRPVVPDRTPCACRARLPRRRRSRSLSTVTIDNYGGNSCGYEPGYQAVHLHRLPPLPAARAIRELKEGQALAGRQGVRPYIHLVDGGVSDNVGMRGVLDALQLLEALARCGPAHAARSREADRRPGRELALVTAYRLGHVEQGPGTVDAADPASSDRSLLVRGG